MTTKPLEVRLTISHFFLKTHVLFYITLLAHSSGSSRMYRKSTDKLLCEACSSSLFYGLKLQIEPHPTRCHYPLITYLTSLNGVKIVTFPASCSSFTIPTLPISLINFENSLAKALDNSSSESSSITVAVFSTTLADPDEKSRIKSSS